MSSGEERAVAIERAAARAEPPAGRGRVPPGLLALGVALWALLAAAWVSTTVFDRLPHVEDEVAFLFQARTMAAGHIVAPAPPVPAAFSIPFVIVRDGMWFGKYPPGYPLVLALGVLIGQPWLLNPIAGAVAILLLYRAGRAVYRPGTGLLAAALLATSPVFLLQAGSFMSHVVGLIWATALLLLFARARAGGALLPAVAAGAAVGMLFLARPLTAVGIGLPYALVAAADLAAGPVGRRRALALAAGFLPFVALLLAYNAYTTGSPVRFGYELWWPFDRIGFGPDVGPHGHDLAAGLRNTGYNLDALRRLLFGWPGWLTLLPAALAVGVALVALGARAAARWRGARPALRVPGGAAWGWDLLLAGSALGLILVHIAYWTPGQMYGPRYYFEATGALALLTARGLLHLAGGLAWALRRARLPAGRARPLAAAAVLLPVAVLSLRGLGTVGLREFQAYHDWYAINGDGLRRVAAARIDHAVVFVAASYWTGYAPFFAQNRPTLDGPIVYALDRGPETNRAVMAHFPGRTFYRYAGGRVVRIEP
ncbi:MAG: hypothetical protein QJR03_06975 [Sphaerobacter sp.]|nr:hypothetical protein [Sphaerobacter sp.]